MNRACLTYVFAFVIFVFQAALGTSSQIILKTSEDIDAYTFTSFEKIQNRIKSIVETPSQQQTFENTLKAWNQIADELIEITDTLKSIEYSEIVQDFYAALNSEIFQNVALHDSLKNYAHKSLGNHSLNPYQQFIAQRFLEKSEPYQIETIGYHYVKGLAKEKKSRKGNFTIYSPEIEKTPRSLQGIIEEIFDADADVVVLQKINEIDKFGEIYDALKECYSHFYTTIDCRSFSSNFFNVSDGFIIVSKFPIDFILKNKKKMMSLLNAVSLEAAPIFISHKAVKSFKEAQPILVDHDEDFLILCKHKEKFEVERETDDEGNSNTKAKGSCEYEKDDYWINGSVWVEHSDEDGKSKNECGAGVECRKRF